MQMALLTDKLDPKQFKTVQTLNDTGRNKLQGFEITRQNMIDIAAHATDIE